MEKIKVMVYVDGGICHEVYGENIEWSIVDWDSMESGCCPYCNTELEWHPPKRQRFDNFINRLRKRSERHYGPHDWCPQCKVNPDDIGSEGFYEMWMEGEIE